MNDILEKILPKPPRQLEEKGVSLKPPSKFALHLLSTGRTVCPDVYLLVLDKAFHKNEQEALALLSEYQKTSKSTVYVGSQDLVTSKMNECVPYLLKTLREKCGGPCSLSLKIVEL